MRMVSARVRVASVGVAAMATLIFVGVHAVTALPTATPATPTLTALTRLQAAITFTPAPAPGRDAVTFGLDRPEWGDGIVHPTPAPRTSVAPITQAQLDAYLAAYAGAHPALAKPGTLSVTTKLYVADYRVAADGTVTTLGPERIAEERSSSLTLAGPDTVVVPPAPITVPVP